MPGLLEDASPTQADQDVIAALRLAAESTDDPTQLTRVMKAILGEAPETPNTNTGGVNLLLAMHRAGILAFEVSV